MKSILLLTLLKLEFFPGSWSCTKCLNYDMFHLHIPQLGGCPRGVMVKAMDCGIVVNEFELQSHDYHIYQPLRSGRI